MSGSSFALDLARYGPAQRVARAPSRAESRAYCQHLAQTHYENFSVASWLLPRELRTHFYHVYAYCRWADDLADETAGGDESLALLDWWEQQLDDCYRGSASHPVFVALAETIDEFAIPAQPFRDLLVAFRQDQSVHRYETFDELLGYCRYSANPVGHLVLYLGRAYRDETAYLADSITTGLQLANFWQDVARDWDLGRVYLPRESCRAFGYDESDFAARRANEAFRALLKHEVARAEQYLLAGVPLVAQVPRELRLDVWLFAQGGLAILAAIRRAGYDVWAQQPTIGRSRQLRLLARGLLLNWLGRLHETRP